MLFLGYYNQLTTTTCAKCHYSCLTCSAPNDNNCLSCPDSLTSFRTNTICKIVKFLFYRLINLFFKIN